MSARPDTYYFHRPGKTRTQDRFQRQSATAVRARSKAKYHADQEKAKAINAAWQREHAEQHREAVRLSRQRNLAKTLARERAAWLKRRTPEVLAKMAAYSRAYRLRKKGFKGVPLQTCTPQCIDHNRGQ
jgi:hypothetical protein